MFAKVCYKKGLECITEGLQISPHASSPRPLLSVHLRTSGKLQEINGASKLLLLQGWESRHLLQYDC